MGAEIEERFKEAIREGGLTEYRLKVRLVVRVGDVFSGWAQNNVEAVLRERLPRHGVMVDEVHITDCMEVE